MCNCCFRFKASTAWTFKCWILNLWWIHICWSAIHQKRGSCRIGSWIIYCPSTDQRRQMKRALKYGRPGAMYHGWLLISDLTCLAYLLEWKQCSAGLVNQSSWTSVTSRCWKKSILFEVTPTAHLRSLFCHSFHCISTDRADWKS